MDLEEIQPDQVVPDKPTDAPTEEIPSDQVELDSDKYSTLPQQVLTGAEGAAKGFAGPLATYAEKKLSDIGVPGLSVEEQEGRQKENPWVHGLSEAAGTIGGLTTGVGELGLLSKGAEAVTGAMGLAGEASKAARVGSAAVKGLIEMSGLATGDEVSKQILGRGDPEEPVASALANIGAQGLFGAATGGILTLGGMGAGAGLKWMANNRLGNAVGQFLEDFGNRWKFNQENPSLIDSVYNELKDFHESTSDAASEVYGSQGLRNQAVEKLTNSVTPEQISKHSGDVAKVFEKIPREIKAEPLFTTALGDWNSQVTKEGATPADIFKATDLLKRQFQEWGEHNKAFVSLRDAPFVKAAREIGSGLKDTLEDSSVWNEAGTLQKGVNKAFSEYIAPLKDFRGKFTTKVEGTNVIDPQKIKTYVNNIGKTGADVSEEIRPQMMKNYIQAAEKYRDKISDLHALNGLESPLRPSSLDVTKNSYGLNTAGGKLADDIFRGGIGRLSGSSASAAGFKIAEHAGMGIGGEVGAIMLGKYIGDKLSPIADKTIGAASRKWAIPAILKVLEVGRPQAIGEALEHAENIAKGNSAMEAGVNALFTGAKLKSSQFLHEPYDKTRDKIKKFVAEGGLNQQIQNSLQKTAPSNQPVVPHFAHGGEVKKQEHTHIKQDMDKSAESSKLGEVYPDQGALMTQAKGRVYNYLNGLRPQPVQSGLPFDEDHKSIEKERSYDKAVGIAGKPLSILHEIQKGTVEPEHVQHVRQMWPEVYNQVSKKMTEKMAETKLNKEKMPPFHIRQAMGLFLGTPLDSTMTPAAIQAAQSVFMNQKAASQATPQTKPKKNTSKLGEISKSYQTGPQAAESRRISEK